MVKIRHLAIKSANPGRLAKFYQETLGLEIIHNSPRGGYFLTDGYLTIALLPQRPEGSPPGINHFGIVVEDAEELGRKIVASGLPAPTQRPATTPYAEQRAMDPDGNLFDISEHGYQTVELQSERNEKRAALADTK